MCILRTIVCGEEAPGRAAAASLRFATAEARRRFFSSVRDGCGADGTRAGVLPRVCSKACAPSTSCVILAAVSDAIDWAALERLRGGFLGEGPIRADYWRTPSELAAYDRFFARRIGWKWDAVLDEARACGFAPSGATVLDWGCGTGVASRRLCAAFGPEAVGRVLLFDRSPLAVRFALERLAEEAPGVPAAAWDGGGLPPGCVLLVSHVAGELDDDALGRLLALAAQAAAVVWVEPGTTAHARKLVAAREKLRERFAILAPCPHQEVCGILAPGHEADWCHFFAPPPREAFHDREWALFSRRLGIDLRALPTSFLVLARGEAPARAFGRVLGRPRLPKGQALYDLCTARGVERRRLLQRDDKALYKRLGQGVFCPRLGG